MDLAKLEKIIDYDFEEADFLKEALTHRSYIHDNKTWPHQHNERLEFLGDAVLELVVTEILFAEFPDKPEGELTGIRAALVNHIMLSTVAGELGLEKFIYMSRGETKNTGRSRQALLANAVEAVIGAIYQDGGYEPAAKFIKKFIMTHLDRVMADRLFKDAKSELQEIVQNKDKMTPAYEVVNESGPDHSKTFKVAVKIGEEKVAEGIGASKQEAEQEAATMALEKLSEE